MIKKMNITKIKKELRKMSQPCSAHDRDFVLRYLGTSKKFLCVKAPDRDKLLREVLKETKDSSGKKLIAMLDELFSSSVHDYINFAGKFLTKSRKARESVSLRQIEKWVSKTEGWAECDVICQSLFDEKEVLERWKNWEKFIRKLSKSESPSAKAAEGLLCSHSAKKSKNIQLRRASLVLQVKSNGKSHDPRLRKLAFETVEKLKHEKSVLITKAISWVLREMSRKNKEVVKKYLLANKSTLPPIAYRETMRKITTGKK